MQPDSRQYDAVVIGGGIYGIMIAREAASRGLGVALVERDGWGRGTTASWLRILHGGLRYLQHLDLPRFFESVRERRWFLLNFPQIVKPLPFVMPLYAAQPPATGLVRAALAVNDALSWQRNRGVPRAQRIPRSRILTPTEVREALPFISSQGLRSGVLWHDAIALEPERLLQEMLQAAISKGVDAFDRTEAVALSTDNGTVSGVEVRDAATGNEHMLRARVVVNASGHSAPGLARRFGQPTRRAPSNSWAWNVLLDMPCEREFAAAIRLGRDRGQTVFVLPWLGRTLVGTGHAPVDRSGATEVPLGLVEAFVARVNDAAPRLCLTQARIVSVLSGHLPASDPEASQLTRRPFIYDHAQSGARGFFTVWGVKYTTARAVAAAVVRRIV